MKSAFDRTMQQLPGMGQPILFVVVVLLISMLFPAGAKFKYAYERQQAWNYGDLTAPFDFPILKSQSELNAERERILLTAPAVYEYAPAALQNAQTQFTQQFDQRLAQDTQYRYRHVAAHSERYLKYGLALLERHFEQYILPAAATDSLLTTQSVIMLVAGNTFREIPRSSLPDVDAVRATITDSLPYAPLPEADFLLPLLSDNLYPSLVYSATLSQQIRDAELGKMVSTKGMVFRGSPIVQKGGIVTDEVYEMLHSFEEASKSQDMPQPSSPWVFFGYLLLTTLVITIFGIYLKRHAPFLYKRHSKLAFILLWILIFSYLVNLLSHFDDISSYIIPFCIVPIVVKTFYNEKVALFTHLAVVMVASYLSALGYEYLFLQLLAGSVVVISRIDTRDWTGFFYLILSVFITYSVGYLGLSLIKETHIADIDRSIFIWLFFNAFLTLLAYPLIPLWERLFGFVSPITLVELSDMNRPLLRELALKAPGTLQHSLQVANMAEAAAQSIKANALLVKVGALYHDIGKTINPTYFTENQMENNPHKDITDLESASLIIAHVAEGVKLAKKAGLPPILIDFIRTHHGTTRTEYFYRKHLDECKSLDGNDDAFRYQGPLPHSKEETILMLADSIEAACKSIPSPTEDELFQLIDKIIAYKLKDGQLKESALSFRELAQCKAVFKQIMRSVHRARIAYPDADE